MSYPITINILRSCFHFHFLSRSTRGTGLKFQQLVTVVNLTSASVKSGVRLQVICRENFLASHTSCTDLDAVTATVLFVICSLAASTMAFYKTLLPLLLVLFSGAVYSQGKILQLIIYSKRCCETSNAVVPHGVQGWLSHGL